MKRIVMLALVLITVGACSTHLTDSTAEQAIASNSLIDQRSDAVRVEAISQASGSTEAIVRAVIAGTRLDLKMRKFDNGWSWEAVETKGGNFVTTDVAMAELRENQRQQRAVRWASEHLLEYADSAKAVNIYVNSLPSSTIMGIREGWFKMRELSVRGAKSGNWTEAQRRDRIKMFSEPAMDAWGQEVLMAFDEASQMATFLSVGPDEAKGTEDDVVCVAAGQRVWSAPDERQIWEYQRTWRLPEHLGKAVAPYLEKGDRVEFSKGQK